MKTAVKAQCAFKDICVDVDSGKCNSCLNNEKRSYYRSDYYKEEFLQTDYHQPRVK